MSRAFIINVILAVIIFCYAFCNEVSTGTGERILSRRKRFLIFPQGSSFSVAVCMTVGVWGNPQFSMFSWGVNYGFAYNLPTNSAYFQNPPHDHLTNFPFLDLFPFRDLSNSDEDTATPSTTTTTTTTEVPATDASMMSPDSHEMLGIMDTNASKRYDWDYFLNDNSLNRIKASNVQSPIYYQRPVYEYNNNELPTVISSNIYPVYYPPKIETKPMMQRRYRRDLFKNIESVLNRMGYDGRDCVLRALCETPQIVHKIEKRSMVQELIKTIFSFPKSKVLPFEPAHSDLMVYDEVHRRSRRSTVNNCAEQFSYCGFSLIELALGRLSSSMAQFSFM